MLDYPISDEILCCLIGNDSSKGQSKERQAVRERLASKGLTNLLSIDFFEMLVNEYLLSIKSKEQKEAFLMTLIVKINLEIVNAKAVNTIAYKASESPSKSLLDSFKNARSTALLEQKVSVLLTLLSQHIDNSWGSENNRAFEILRELGKTEMRYTFTGNNILDVSVRLKQQLYNNISSFLQDKAKANSNFTYKSIIEKLNLLPEPLRLKSLESQINKLVAEIDTELEGYESGVFLEGLSNFDILTYVLLADTFRFYFYLISDDNADLRDMLKVREQKLLLSSIVREYDKLSKPNRVPRKINKSDSLRWNGNSQKELPILHNLLIEAGMVNPKTLVNEFEEILSGQAKVNAGQIYWESTNRALSHFLELCFTNQRWQSIFDKGEWLINSNGKTINSRDLASAKGEKLSNSQVNETIESILKEIKKPDRQ